MSLLKRPILDGDMEAIATVCAFLTWLERDHGPRTMWGGRTLEETLQAFGHIIGASVQDIREISGAED